jgi:predicted AAA+ superfamily ATPase
MYGKNVITITRYIDYFESLHIMSRLPCHTGSKIGSSRHPKIYLSDIGLRNAILGILDAPIGTTERGHVAETVAHDHILRLAYKLNASSHGHVSCVIGKTGEIDFVVNFPKYSVKLPIEIKFRKTPGNLSGFYEFAGNGLGIVVTENTLNLDGNTLFLPMWIFLLMC